MQKWLLKILVCSVNAFILAYLLKPHVQIKDMLTAVCVAVVLSFLDAIVKPLLIFLTLPATVITLGLFLLVINAFVILIDAHYVGGFKVDGFGYAMLFSVLLSFFNGLVNGKVKISVNKFDDDKNR